MRLKASLLALIIGAASTFAWSWSVRQNREPEDTPEALDAVPADTLVLSPPASDAKVQVTELQGGGPEDEAAMQRIYGAFALGDFSGALSLADTAALDSKLSVAFRHWLSQQMPSILVSAGWSKLRLGDCEQATDWLRRAVALTPAPAAVKGLAVCFYKQKQMSLAREQFLNYLALEPNDSEMLLLYTDVLESEGRFVDAVGILKQLQTLAENPAANLDGAAIGQRLQSMQSREKESASMQTEASRNFRLSFRSGDHEDLVAFVLQALEDAADEFRESFGLPAPQSQIEVVMYPAASFQGVTGGGPAWAEGLYDGRIRIPVRPEPQKTDKADLDIVLRHELVHALLAQLGDSRTVPPWFGEGVAQRLSCAGRSCGRFAFPPQPGGFLPPDSFASSYLALSTVNAGRAYQQSLFLILTIEALKGEQSLRQILTSVTTSSDISSDGLLLPVGLDFTRLHAAASELWIKRQSPDGR
ncbi:MAG: hypothetical protein FJ146_08155 [Deltaproteobacteria bacterium]|nr:hypothetical protein [Deltaproteobacteria bacterium]